MKKSFIIILVAVIAGVAAVTASLIISQQGVTTTKPDTEIAETPEPETPPAEQKPSVSLPENFAYRVRYDFGNETYIYLNNDNTIDIVSVYEVYDFDEACNCYTPVKGLKVDTKRNHFTGEVKATAIATIEELAQQAGKNDFNADAMQLTTKQKTVLLSTILDDTDWMTLRQSLVIRSHTDGSITYQTIDPNTSNKTAQKIAQHINEIVINDYKALRKHGGSATLNLKVAHIGPYHASLYYYKTDGGSKYDARGYVYNGTGAPHKFELYGVIREYYTQTIANFKKTEYYAKYKNSFAPGWEESIERHLLNTGLWYETEGGAMVIIRGSMLAADGRIPEDCEVFIEAPEEDL